MPHCAFFHNFLYVLHSRSIHSAISTVHVNSYIISCMQFTHKNVCTLCCMQCLQSVAYIALQNTAQSLMEIKWPIPPILFGII